MLAVLLVALPAGAVTIDWVTVGDPGNAADSAAICLNAAADCGAVADAYRISKYEVTNDQYAEFLNAVAGTDTNALYSTEMSSDARGGITRSGLSGSYTYAVKSGQGNNPVVLVNWYDAVRFTNWLHNGQPIGAQDATTTEDGAYTFADPTTVGARESGALTFLPTENEWYKAAYYSPGGTYFDYPTGTNTPTECVAPGSDTGNSANCAASELTDVGAYALSASPYGTFDQGGNVWEWNETASGSSRGLRGGGWSSTASNLAASPPGNLGPAIESPDVGFRVASLVPEPAQLLLVLTGGLVLAVVRKRHAKAL